LSTDAKLLDLREIIEKLAKVHLVVFSPWDNSASLLLWASASPNPAANVYPSFYHFQNRAMRRPKKLICYPLLYQSFVEVS